MPHSHAAELWKKSYGLPPIIESVFEGVFSGRLVSVPSFNMDQMKY